MFFEQVAQLAHRPVLVVRERIDDDRGAARAVRFVRHFFVAHTRFLTGAAPDGPLDVFRGHVGGLRVRDDGAQARVHVRVPAAGPRRHGEFLDDARENPAALGVQRAFLMLD